MRNLVLITLNIRPSLINPSVCNQSPICYHCSLPLLSAFFTLPMTPHIRLAPRLPMPSTPHMGSDMLRYTFLPLYRCFPYCAWALIPSTPTLRLFCSPPLQPVDTTFLCHN